MTQKSRDLTPLQAVNEIRNNNNGQVVLVLQGGGALGAYQCGVYQALHEAGVEPDWIIGTSIGAINAAIIAHLISWFRVIAFPQYPLLPRPHLSQPARPFPHSQGSLSNSLNLCRQRVANLRRVAEVNRSPYFRCRVRAVGVFGGYLTEISPLNKLDLVVRLVPKPLRPGDTHRGRAVLRVPYWRLQKSLRPEQWPDWEQLHVELYLLAGQPSLVLHRPDEPILRGQRIRIVYLERRDEPAPVTPQTGDSA